MNNRKFNKLLWTLKYKRLQFVCMLAVFLRGFLFGYVYRK